MTPVTHILVPYDFDDVMATHGRSGVAHFFLGRVAERVIRTAPCPVLVVWAAAVQRQT